MKPNFLIIGAQRGGTTSLHNYVCAHPKVSRIGKPRKEIHFFDYPQNWKRGVGWYRELFAGHKGLVGEKSPTYLDHPLVPLRVKRVCPDAKILVILRNPVDRAHSDYWKIRAIGREDIETFEGALRAETFRLANDLGHNDLWTDYYFKSHHLTHGYVRRGQYALHLIDWLKLFPREQMLILKSEEFFAETAQEMRKVYQFLGLKPHKMKKFKQYQKMEYPPMREKTRRWLEDLFRQHNEGLAELLGDGRWMW